MKRWRNKTIPYLLHWRKPLPILKQGIGFSRELEPFVCLADSAFAGPSPDILHPPVTIRLEKGPSTSNTDFVHDSAPGSPYPVIIHGATSTLPDLLTIVLLRFICVFTISFIAKFRVFVNFTFRKRVFPM